MTRSPDDIVVTARTIVMIICRDSKTIFQRLLERTSKLAACDSLLRDLSTMDVATNADYQRRYNGFYRVRGRSKQWRATYYYLLQSRKQNRKVRFDEVIRALYKLTNRIEPSFSSKLVATVRPELPVYDAVVCGHMHVMVPPQSSPARDRIERLITECGRMIEIAKEVVKTAEFRTLRTTFDKHFASYGCFTDTKKLDLMLWQSRTDSSRPRRSEKKSDPRHALLLRRTTADA